MSTIMRRATYKLYPSASQAVEMERILVLHQRLYNGALEERIGAYRKAKKSISFAEQCKSVTQVRADLNEYGALNGHSLQVTLKRLDLAFKAFFRRCKAGVDPKSVGFPRFKSRDRFPGWGYKEHGCGFRFDAGNGWRHGHLRLSGIGTMQARGVARTPGRVKTADIRRNADGWYLSLVIACEPHRERASADAGGDRECGLDWGVETFVTLAYGPGEYIKFENDRLLDAQQDALNIEQRALSKALRGKRSRRALKAKRAMAKRHQRIVNRRKDRNHQISAHLVRDHKLIVTEQLTVTNMTASARGTVETPGNRVAQKAGLNRAILDATPGGFLNMLTYKAEEAGTWVESLNTKKHKPSQTCPCCQRVRKKALSERHHRCDCGFKATRDQAAALAMLGAGLRLSGREPAWARASGPETVLHSALCA